MRAHAHTRASRRHTHTHATISPHHHRPLDWRLRYAFCDPGDRSVASDTTISTLIPNADPSPRAQDNQNNFDAKDSYPGHATEQKSANNPVHTTDEKHTSSPNKDASVPVDAPQSVVQTQARRMAAGVFDDATKAHVAAEPLAFAALVGLALGGMLLMCAWTRRKHLQSSALERRVRAMRQKCSVQRQLVDGHFQQGVASLAISDTEACLKALALQTTSAQGLLEELQQWGGAANSATAALLSRDMGELRGLLQGMQTLLHTQAVEAKDAAVLRRLAEDPLLPEAARRDCEAVLKALEEDRLLEAKAEQAMESGTKEELDRILNKANKQGRCHLPAIERATAARKVQSACRFRFAVACDVGVHRRTDRPCIRRTTHVWKRSWPEVQHNHPRLPWNMPRRRAKASPPTKGLRRPS